MKKALSLIIMLAMLLSTCTFLASYSTVSAATLLGDLNGDGEVNSKDSLLLKKYVVGKTTAIDVAAADLNGDGDVGSKDCKVMKEYLAGTIDSFTSVAKSGVKKMEIAGNDLSQYDIIIRWPADSFHIKECYNYAAKELCGYLEEATGLDLDIVDASSKSISAVSSKPHHIILAFEEKALGPQGYRWTVDANGDLTIAGGYRTGNLNGVFEFLDEYVGWRFFERNCEYLIPSDLVSVPAGLDKTFIPQYLYRDVHKAEWIEGSGVEFLCAANHINSHDDRGYCENEKYGWGKGNVWVHGHSFEYIYGISNQEQPCLSVAANKQTAINWVCNLMSERQSWGGRVGFNLSRVSVSWNDNTNFCSCGNCMATYNREESLAGVIVPFNNDVSTAVRSRGWDIHIYYIAYGAARIPPRYARPNDYCDICYCWNGCNNHTFDSNECDEIGNTKAWTNWKERYYFEFWAKIAKNLEVWYYATNFSWNIGACPNVLNIRKDFRYLAEQGVSGIYAECEGDAIYNFECLRSYVMAKCMWDPYLSEAEFQRRIDEFCAYKYGPGWRYIKEYLYMNDEAGNRCGCFTNNYDWPGDMLNVYYMYENYDYMCSLFDQAKALAENSTQIETLEKLSVQLHWIALSGAICTDGNSAIVNNSKLSARYDEMFNYIQKYKYVASIYGVPQRGSTTVYGVYLEGYNKRQSPMISWLSLEVPDGSWSTYYKNRPKPYEGKYDPENMWYFIHAGKPTKTFNPLAEWIP